ncbi:unnamed protein product [Rotaria magnacalcarata]|uniref:Uncharacterized protein n=2 Tax=Rotaria magnacalcarata TaxID=392030 RepID=A0A814W980_9BILA|nr:unnamed protein product [Rotaria magnacalcarata]CAF3804324.1 unnamed protein product [Rotaria magnacalcarata]CAF3907312.1 unnamed protein product [Rotaria magnacalcarata]CAF4347805.1 unnamed protein product [Rotaria magnacalcarata]
MIFELANIFQEFMDMISSLFVCQSIYLIGTNSLYENRTRAADITQQAIDEVIKTKSKFTIKLCYEKIRVIIECDGIVLADAGDP